MNITISNNFLWQLLTKFNHPKQICRLFGVGSTKDYKCIVLKVAEVFYKDGFLENSWIDHSREFIGHGTADYYHQLTEGLYGFNMVKVRLHHRACYTMNRILHKGKKIIKLELVCQFLRLFPHYFCLNDRAWIVIQFCRLVFTQNIYSIVYDKILYWILHPPHLCNDWHSFMCSNSSWARSPLADWLAGWFSHFQPECMGSKKQFWSLGKWCTTRLTATKTRLHK